MATIEELLGSLKARNDETAVLRYCVSATFGPGRDSREFDSPHEAAQAFHEMDAKDYPRVILTDGSFARTVADCASKGTGNDAVVWKYAASSDPVFHGAYGRVLAIDKIAQAEGALDSRRAAHTGSWADASVLRKEAVALRALRRAVEQSDSNVDLFAALEGTGSFDTEAERRENRDRDLEALGRLSPALQAVKGLGIAVASVLDEPQAPVLSAPVPRKASIQDLDPDQQVAVISFRAQHGRNWKQKLLDGWLRAAYPGHLQAIRNQFGPEWLTEVKDVPSYRLSVVLTSTDGCEGTFAVAWNGKGQVVRESAIAWAPHDPDAHTESVAFRRYSGDELEGEYIADGDFWRAIEDGGLEDDLYESMLKGAPLAEAVEAVPLLGSRPGM